MTIGAVLFLTLSAAAVGSGVKLPPSGSVFFSQYSIYYQWKFINFYYPEGVSAAELRQKGALIDKNVIPSTIRVFKDRMFIATPRLKPGVPSTLSVVPYNRYESYGLTTDEYRSPNLWPFPDYDMQEIGNCSAFQHVSPLEVDQFGRLWVVDAGRVDALTDNPRNLCPPKLVIIDLLDNDQVICTYEFPDSVASQTTSVLKDMQVACVSEDNCMVYISNVLEGNVVVYDHANRESWKVTHPSMLADPAAANFTVDGSPTSVNFAVASLALAPRNQNFSALYYAPIASLNLYRVNTDALQDPARKTNPALSDSDVVNLGRKPGQSDGIAMDERGTLYYGDLPGSAVIMTDLSNSSTTTLYLQNQVAQSSTDLHWADTFGFDDRGNLLLTTTKFDLFLADNLNLNETNFRVVRFATGTKAYNE